MTYTFQTLYIELPWSDALNIDALRYIRLELSEQKYGDWIHTEINITEIDQQPISLNEFAVLGHLGSQDRQLKSEKNVNFDFELYFEGLN